MAGTEPPTDPQRAWEEAAVIRLVTVGTALFSRAANEKLRVRVCERPSVPLPLSGRKRRSRASPDPGGAGLAGAGNARAGAVTTETFGPMLRFYRKGSCGNLLNIL